MYRFGNPDVGRQYGAVAGGRCQLVKDSGWSRRRPRTAGCSLGDASIATPAVVNGAVYFGDFGNAASILIADHGQFREFAAKVVDAVA